MNIGFPEMIVILIIALLLFGRRLPEVARSLGKGITEFKKGMKDIDDNVRIDASAESRPPTGAPQETPKAG